MAPEPSDPTLHLPRILCLHGGGVTAEAFRLQSRALITRLKSTFRLVFADGPFLCDPGPGIIPVYADFAPFRRWLRWLPEHKEIDAESAVEEVWYQIRDAMDSDTREGATGEWVGLMGFSQGAKVSASLLYEQQVKEEKLGKGKAGTTWRFAVLLAGRAPLVSLSTETAGNEALVDAAEISEGFETVNPELWEGWKKLEIPTLHVHGLSDPGLHLHRRLLNQYCEPSTTTVVEWEGNHRVPIKKTDVDPIIIAIMDIARNAGAIP
jgi:pimeloyl-ACP methyl ester carboxylesterase